MLPRGYLIVLFTVHDVFVFVALAHAVSAVVGCCTSLTLSSISSLLTLLGLENVYLSSLFPFLLLMFCVFFLKSVNRCQRWTKMGEMLHGHDVGSIEESASFLLV